MIEGRLIKVHHSQCKIVREDEDSWVEDNDGEVIIHIPIDMSDDHAMAMLEAADMMHLVGYRKAKDKYDKQEG